MTICLFVSRNMQILSVGSSCENSEDGPYSNLDNN